METNGRRIRRKIMGEGRPLFRKRTKTDLEKEGGKNALPRREKKNLKGNQKRDETAML